MAVNSNAFVQMHACKTFAWLKQTFDKNSNRVRDPAAAEEKGK
jgi:hypothetical protein